MTPTKTPIKNKVKRTYVLSSQNMAQFEAEVAPGKRGVAVDEAIALWMEEQRRTKIRAAMEEFGRDAESQALYAQIDREWAPLSDEVWAHIDDDWSKMTPEAMDEEFRNGH